MTGGVVLRLLLWIYGGLPYIGCHFMQVIQVARFLIGHGADAMAWTNDGESPLYYMASTRGIVQVTRFLVRTRQYDITRGGYIECGMGRGKSSIYTCPPSWHVARTLHRGSDGWAISTAL